MTVVVRNYSQNIVEPQALARFVPVSSGLFRGFILAICRRGVDAASLAMWEDLGGRRGGAPVIFRVVQRASLLFQWN
jgi:hypothetical protein